MKKTLLLTVLIYALNVSAQISIDQSDMPVVGDTLRYSVAEITPAFLSTYQNTGSNYTWNYSNLNPEAQGVDEYYSSSQTSYNFPNTIARKYADSIDMGGVVLENVYEFFSSTAASFNTVGRGITYSGIPFSISYTDQDELYQFPLDYLDYDSSTFQAQFINPFLQIYYSSEGYRINEVDGYGQITTPYGTFNVLRVVTDIVQSDTISYNSNNYKLDTHLREYKWLAKGIEYPVLIVSGSVNFGTFVPASVTYRDSVRNIIVGINEKNVFAQAFSISPNPVLDKVINLEVKLPEPSELQVQLLDMSGKSIGNIQTFNVGRNINSIQVELPSSVSHGIYFLNVSSNGYQSMHKLVVGK